MKATLLAKAKEVRDDGTIVEVVIWELAATLEPCGHRLKYRLFYGGASQLRAHFEADVENWSAT